VHFPIPPVVTSPVGPTGVFPWAEPLSFGRRSRPRPEAFFDRRLTPLNGGMDTPPLLLSLRPLSILLMKSSWIQPFPGE